VVLEEREGLSVAARRNRTAGVRIVTSSSPKVALSHPQLEVALVLGVVLAVAGSTRWSPARMLRAMI